MNEDKDEVARLGSIIANYLKAYFDATEKCEEEEQERSLRWICAGLERVCTCLLNRYDHWEPGAWVDGISWDSHKVLDSKKLEIIGQLDWVGSHMRYIEAFIGLLQLAQTETAQIRYTIRIGFAG